MRALLTVARYTWLEAWRGGLRWLALGALLAALILAAFLSQVAIVEGDKVQASVAAALLRAAAAFLIAAHVVSSLGREAADKMLEFTLAFPLSRPAYYGGKLAGFAAAGLALACVFALPLSAWSTPGAVAAWWLSLALELALVAAAAQFFVLSLRQPAPALAATAGLYVLGRSMSALRDIAATAQGDATALSEGARWMVDALAFLLPALDRVTQADWLLYGAPTAGELATACGMLLAYGWLLVAAGLFDLSRRNF